MGPSADNGPTANRQADGAAMEMEALTPRQTSTFTVEDHICASIRFIIAFSCFIGPTS